MRRVVVWIVLLLFIPVLVAVRAERAHALSVFSAAPSDLLCQDSDEDQDADDDYDSEEFEEDSDDDSYEYNEESDDYEMENDYDEEIEE